MEIKHKHSHECNGNCRPHTTRLDDGDLEMATSIPMPKEVVAKMKFLLDKTGAELDEGKKYLMAGMVFITIAVVGMFISNVMWVIGLIGSVAMHLFYWHTTKNVSREMGFVDGILFLQANFARGLAEFTDEVESGKKKVPKEIKDIIMQSKADRMKE